MRSDGYPSPSTLAEDGDAALNFLTSAGFRSVLAHGRSIGAVAACHLAASHPGVVKMLVADRAFGNLQAVANFGLGRWAEIGLKMALFKADNTSN